MAKNILVLIDFSPLTEPVLSQAAELARFSMAKCWLVHIAAPNPEFVGFDVGPQYIRDSRAEELREEHQELQRQKAALEAQGISAEALLIQGPTLRTVLAETEKLNIDLVLLGNHRHTRLHDLLVGSLCEQLIRQAKVPLLIIPAGEETNT